MVDTARTAAKRTPRQKSAPMELMPAESSTQAVQIRTVQEHAIATAPRTPADVLIYAMDQGADVERIQALMDLQMRWDAEQARKAYVADMALFKVDPPKIFKEKLVSFDTEKSGNTSYMHATLGNVVETIVAGLAAHGFSHRWETSQDKDQIVVTCVITHKAGHSEKTTLSNSRDESGKKNNIQAMGSTITYLQRYTLLAATGLATQDQDDDGVGAEFDVRLADLWIGEAKKATCLDDLASVWERGTAAIGDAADSYALKEFNAAVNAIKAQLQNPARTRNTGTGGRFNKIIGDNT